MASTTKRAAPLSKLRVTCLRCSALLPQCSHKCSADVDRDDNEFAGETKLDDRFGRLATEGDAFNDVFDFAGFGIALPRGDLAREDDVFEIEDSKVVIVKLFGCVG